MSKSENINKAIKLLKSKAVIVVLALGVGFASGGTINPAMVKSVAEATVTVLEVVNDSPVACE